MAKLLDFYKTIHKIKHIERKGWKKIGIKGVTDTIASHSFGSSLLSWYMANKEGFDSSKLVKMLLIHDLIMAYIDDYMPENSDYKKKRALENDAASKLLDIIPDEIKEEFTELFFEYQEEKTDLAIFARECDKLDTLFQAFIYSQEVGKDKLNGFIKSYENKIRSKTGKEIIKSLQR